MKRENRGFTLIEVMIVVVIVGILASIAYPSYEEFVRRGHRADARAGLLAAQQWLERAATATGTYPGALPPALTWVGDGSKRYTIAYAAGAIAGANYTLSAVPRNPDPQALDRCGTYTLTETGQRGNNGASLSVAECWGK